MQATSACSQRHCASKSEDCAHIRGKGTECDVRVLIITCNEVLCGRSRHWTSVLCCLV
jgi:hypothetical protein